MLIIHRRSLGWRLALRGVGVDARRSAEASRYDVWALMPVARLTPRATTCGRWCPSLGWRLALRRL